MQEAEKAVRRLHKWPSQIGPRAVSANGTYPCGASGVGRCDGTPESCTYPTSTSLVRALFQGLATDTESRKRHAADR